MSYWLAQLILAARNRGDGWMQILVFIILAIFYSIGSIVKAKANKTAPKKKERIPRKPVRKPPEGVRELFKQPQRPAKPIPRGQPRPQVAKPQVQAPRRKVARPQPVGRKPSTKAVLKPQVQAKLGEIPEFTTKVEGLKEKRVAAPAEMLQAEYLSEILSDYDDLEKLRRAILHYEILGKPLSLREPSEHIIGL